MWSRFVIDIHDPEICSEVAKRMLARGVRIIFEPPVSGDPMRIYLP